MLRLVRVRCVTCTRRAKNFNKQSAITRLLQEIKAKRLDETRRQKIRKYENEEEKKKKKKKRKRKGKGGIGMYQKGEGKKSCFRTLSRQTGGHRGWLLLLGHGKYINIKGHDVKVLNVCCIVVHVEGHRRCACTSPEQHGFIRGGQLPTMLLALVRSFLGR